MKEMKRKAPAATRVVTGGKRVMRPLVAHTRASGEVSVRLGTGMGTENVPDALVHDNAAEDHRVHEELAPLAVPETFPLVFAPQARCARDVGAEGLEEAGVDVDVAGSVPEDGRRGRSGREDDRLYHT